MLGLDFVHIKHNVSLWKSGQTWVNFNGVLCSLPCTLFAALSSFLHPSERHSAFHYDLTSPLMLSGAIFNCFWIWKCKRGRRNTKEMQVAVAWMTCCKQSPAHLETPLWAAVLHSLLAHLYTVLLIQTARWILSDLSLCFFPLSRSEILSQIFVKSERNRAGGVR